MLLRVLILLKEGGLQTWWVLFFQLSLWLIVLYYYNTLQKSVFVCLLLYRSVLLNKKNAKEQILYIYIRVRVCVWWNWVPKNRKTGLTSVFENTKPFYCSLKILKIELWHSFIFLSDHNLLQGSYKLSPPSVEKILIHAWSNWHCREETKLPSPCVLSPVNLHKCNVSGPLHCAAPWNREIQRNSIPALCCTLLHRKGKLQLWFLLWTKKPTLGRH